MTVISREASCRGQAMDMGMQHQVLTPGMQDTQKPDAGAKVLGIGGDLQHGRCTRPEQQVVQKRRILLTELIQLMRQREHDMEI